MSSSSSRAVNMMIGTVLSARRRLQTSRPSRSWQHQVEHDEIDVLLGEAGERLSPSRVHDLEAVPLERIGEQLLDEFLVVDEQDGGGISAMERMLGRRAVPYTGRCNGAAQTSAPPRARLVADRSSGR